MLCPFLGLEQGLAPSKHQMIIAGPKLQWWVTGHNSPDFSQNVHWEGRLRGQLLRRLHHFHHSCIPFHLLPSSMCWVFFSRGFACLILCSLFYLSCWVMLLGLFQRGLFCCLDEMLQFHWLRCCSGSLIANAEFSCFWYMFSCWFKVCCVQTKLLMKCR